MKLTVMGSGDAANGGGRGHSCYWLDGVGARGTMVDFGGTALMAIKRFGRDPRALDTLLFTHLHGDHIGGFPYFLVEAICCAEPRRDPLRVVGPRGAEARLLELCRVAYGKLATRERPFEMTWIELAPGEAAELDGGRVEAFAADHQDPPEQPLCLRVTGRNGAVVAFSGDTQLCDGLRAAGRGADLLVAECTHPAPPAGRHTTWADWQAEFARLEARRVLLTHLADPMRAQVDALRGELPAGVAVDFAEDGMTVELSPA